MPKFRALELAIEQSTQQRDAQARKHAQAQKTLQFAQGQLQQLQSYSNDTDARWVGGHSVNLSVELIRHHYQFMDRLQHAATQQMGVVANLERQLATAHQALLQAEYRLAAFKQVLKGRRMEQQVVQQRREQRATDEFAAMRHFRDRADRNTQEHV
ncbi:flagellar export protein FliJ [Rhodoferax lacus]|uniref:Flagellar FliJ protein n=1 Tax=Rhodoferax lacus TaxID=2184758 RepID=A0A3E1R7K6_9BURK|nr:flagellar export protein FliJ [Rhodoferax lacus]RFO95022.1 flagellar export protein FliJ [Rhodoferax lacus]